MPPNTRSPIIDPKASLPELWKTFAIAAEIGSPQEGPNQYEILQQIVSKKYPNKQLVLCQKSFCAFIPNDNVNFFLPLIL